MRNKMLAIIGVIVVLFIALYFLDEYKNNDTADSEGTGSDNQENVENADQDGSSNDESEDLYGNQVTPSELDNSLEDGEDVTVYFYSPECVHCQRTTPVLVPLTEEMGVDMKKLNLLEYDDKWDHYDISGTPTVVHYEDGEEAGRVSGEKSEAEFRSFLDEYAVTDNE